MSDFDEVLERLLVDASFKARLASDPRSALAGYRLAPDEVVLLQAQVSTDTGEQHRVEQRTSKASLFGMLSPFAGLGGALGDAASGAGGGGGDAGFDAAGPFAGMGSGGFAPQGLSPAAQDGLQAANDLAQAGFDAAQHGGLGTGNGGFGVADQGGFGDAYAFGDTSPDISGGDPHSGLVGPNLDGVPYQVADQTPHGGIGVGAGTPVDNYHARVDVDGDGKWDDHIYVNRADGGVDIVVDLDHDGRADFIGRDFNRDGLIDESVMDTNHDGAMDTRYVDVNGDGWLDKKVPFDPTGQGQGEAGSHIGRHRAAEEGLG